uniref:Uncharacterized protein n=1 Tax=Anguilla anguilla TaxID=7936 RepID=A0A0E9UV31_ANGAN
MSISTPLTRSPTRQWPFSHFNTSHHRRVNTEQHISY